MATPHSAAIEELLSLYVLGALDGDDLRAVEEHLAGGCADCARLLPELQAEVEALATAPPAVAPSDGALARLMTQLDDRASAPPAPSMTPPAPPAARTPRTHGRAPAWSWLAAAAALALLVWGVTLRSSLSGEIDSLRAELAHVRADRDQAAARSTALASELASAEATSERLAQAMAIISSPAMRPVALAGLKDAPAAKGHTFVDPDGQRAIFVAANLRALPADKTYELWYIADGKPVAAGTFAVDEKGFATVPVARVPPIAQIQAWAVTIEPHGGVPQPTGTMVLKG